MDQDKKILFDKFVSIFNYEPTNYFISPGRLEIIGNHTDHNHGLALVASATLYIKCAASKRSDNIINLNSQGSRFYDIHAEVSNPDEKEYSTTDALIKGVVNGFIKRGYKVGGFDAYCFSEVPSGSGVSSSAAFELLICSILNGLYNDNKVSKLEMAKISQESERVYFGKPCGILDQIGAAYGGICFVDFNDPDNPKVENTTFPFDIKIVLTNPGGSHAGLTSYYASIPNDMFAAAHAFNKEYLRDVSFNEFMARCNDDITAFTPSQATRAIHFYMECERVMLAYKAILNNDLESFLHQINQSGYSSSKVLRNTCVNGRYNTSPERALRIVRKAAPKSGHRVHGGGFVGTIISFVRNEDYDKVVSHVKNVFGDKAVIDVAISPIGAEEY